MDTNPVVQKLIEKTYQELKDSDKPKNASRVATASNGYIFLVAWSNAELLRILVRLFTSSLPKSEYRLTNQLNDAARSVIANIEEGYRRPTTSEYMTFLGYSEASLTEVKGDIERASQDGFLPIQSSSSLQKLGIDLMTWHEAVKQSVIASPEHKGVYRNVHEIKGKNTNKTSQTPLKSFKFLYSPVDNLQANQLTREIFRELINKTDWNVRKLVSSLEEKLARESKYYQVEKARLRDYTKWRK